MLLRLARQKYSGAQINDELRKLMSTIADRISDLIHDHYLRLKPAGKPVVRSNGVKEWTVLAGVVAIDKHNDKLRLVSLATGVKATPDIDLKRSHGKILHDCHAEILAIRAFNTVLLNHIQRIQAEGKDEFSDLIERASDKDLYKIREKWDFALYISKLPCGDASMDSLEDGDDIKISEQDLCQYVDYNNRTILRGRFNYRKKGFVRTKPGRKDSKVTLSKSCSDKLCIRQVISILNSLTWDLLETPIFLKYIVIPQLSTAANKGLMRSFRERMKDHKVYHQVQFLSCVNRFSHDKSSTQELPSLINSIFLNIIDEQESIEEIVLNGVKNGFYVKGTKPLRKHCESSVSRFSQWRCFKSLRPQYRDESYLSFKSHQVVRNVIKERTRLSLSADGWISTKIDDC